MSGHVLLQQHLSWLEQDLLEVSEKFFGKNQLEKSAYEEKMRAYSEQVKKHRHQLDDLSNLPVVLIQSTVTVESIEDGERMDFKIVSPSDDVALGDLEAASYLSPIGKALLLKAKNEPVEVETPQGIIQYKILKIKYS
ncbi:MAG: hypothetical protein BGO41_14670 [Clostridiales bacterium 38-18]|nr:MAG: hypothetical protein BGO41_14670 [Clostridiales bacterium 38-18]